MNEVLVGDCIELMRTLSPQSIPCCFADPPFNIDHKYDTYDDSRTDEDYLGWCRQWMDGVKRLLTPTGSFWLAIGDAYAADLDVLARRTLGFHRRSWVIWHYTFGVNAKRGFTPSHVHLFHYVVDHHCFTFNTEAIRVSSMRQLKYKDSRAKVGGRLPNDVWVLDSKGAAERGEAFFPEGDTWCVSRICGTFKERTSHPCQMPEEVLERIVGVSSNPGETVLDPFAGSGTTLAVAKKMGRNYIGIELSPQYAEGIRERLGQ